MTGIVHQMKVGAGPGAVQVPGGLGRAGHVVAALHDDAGNSGELAGIAKQLPLFEPAGMHKIVVFDARKRQRKVIVAVLGAGSGVGQQRDGLAFPQAPGARGAQLRGAVCADQALAVGGHQVAAFGGRNRRHEVFPQIRKQPGRPFLVVPEQLGAAQREDAAHDQRRHPRRMRLCIGQRQRAAPGAAEHQPALDTQQDAQPLDVGDQVPGRVVVQRSMGARAAAAALVKQQHAVARRVKQPPVIGRATRAGPAMQKNRRPALRVAAQFPVHQMAVAGVEDAGAKRRDGRVQIPGGGGNGGGRNSHADSIKEVKKRESLQPFAAAAGSARGAGSVPDYSPVAAPAQARLYRNRARS